MTALNNTYTLKEFFLGRSNSNEEDYRKIIIPDMQREYCWPSEVNPIDNIDLVTSFIKTLIEMSRKNSPVKMGLLYGYESPQFNIQLCDGQQRLTTLYLTIGLLYKLICQDIADNNKKGIIDVARNILISDFEANHDDKEPRFQYSIRESTLFFLRDLVDNFFLGTTTLDEIVKSEWYFEEYTQDPSIVNINNGIKKIYGIINLMPVSDKEHLLDYIINKLSFLYFDMKDRTHGEEQFVVINTTGMALSFSENLKPVLLGGLTDNIYTDGKSELQYFSDMWEGWEHFFWKNRFDKNSNSFVADNQLKEFFRWVYIIEMSLRDEVPASSESIKYNAAQKAYGSHFNLLDISSDVKILLQTIDDYMEAYKVIVEKGLWISNEKQPIPFEKTFSITDCFRFIPLLYFVKQFNASDSRQVLRIQRLLWELSKHTNYSVEIATVEIIRAIKVLFDKHANEADIAMLVNDDVYPFIRQSILPSDSIIKLKTYILCDSEERVNYENTIWDIENMSCCEGDISFFYNEFLDNNVSCPIPLHCYQRLLDVLNKTANNPNSLFRRSMLTRGDYHEGLSYSKRLNLYTYSFAKDAGYFKSVFRKQTKEESRNIIISFLKDIYNDTIEPNIFMENCIKHYKDNPHDIKEDDYWKRLLDLLITKPSLFDYAQKGVVCYNDYKEGQPIARVFQQETLSQGGERTVEQLGIYYKNEQ